MSLKLHLAGFSKTRKFPDPLEDREKVTDPLQNHEKARTDLSCVCIEALFPSTECIAFSYQRRPGRYLESPWTKTFFFTHKGEKLIIMMVFQGRVYAASRTFLHIDRSEYFEFQLLLNLGMLVANPGHQLLVIGTHHNYYFRFYCAALYYCTLIGGHYTCFASDNQTILLYVVRNSC